MHGKSSNSSIFLPHSPGAVANVAAEARIHRCLSQCLHLTRSRHTRTRLAHLRHPRKHHCQQHILIAAILGVRRGCFCTTLFMTQERIAGALLRVERALLVMSVGPCRQVHSLKLK